jgi:two-component system nitrate/nitrite response regulator NarL
MTEGVKILLVDDHQMFIDGIKSLLSKSDKYEIVAEALNGNTALDILTNTSIDLMITDLSMPEMSGNDLVKKAKVLYPDLKILVLSMHSNRETVSEIMMAEAEGYILKNTGRKELTQALDRIMDNSTFYSNEVMSIMFDKIKKEKKIEQEINPLTDRELEILILIVQELSSEEIAEKLFISRRTVDTHRKHILQKTKSKTIVSLIKFAFRNDLVQNN